MSRLVFRFFTERFITTPPPWERPASVHYADLTELLATRPTLADMKAMNFVLTRTEAERRVLLYLQPPPQQAAAATGTRVKAADGTGRPQPVPAPGARRAAYRAVLTSGPVSEGASDGVADGTAAPVQRALAQRLEDGASGAGHAEEVEVDELLEVSADNDYL
ncbi:hypothetical protein HK405_003232 [Cladochytrium tenue]|nr:hypothetical protein HK405_003232 [Cladochytrium tenue]